MSGYKWFLAICVVAIVVVGGYFYVNSGTGDGLIGTQTIGTYKIGTLAAPVYLEPTATTVPMYNLTAEQIFRTDKVSEVSMNLGLTASTSGVLTWIYYYSDDGVSYFSEDGNTDTSDVVMTHGATAYTHTWTPGTTSTAYKNVSVGTVNSKFFKVVFTPTVASSSLFADIVTKEK